MEKSMTLRRSLLAALAVVALGSGLASPQAAADGDKGKDKDGKVPIIIAQPIITQDPPPPPPKKK